MIRVIGFDADDTLWHNESLFSISQERFVDLLKQYHDEDWIRARLDQTEIRNLEIFGYGVKAFVLSMIETAIELTEGRIRGHEIQVLIQSGKEMIQAPIDPLPNVVQTLEKLAPTHRLMIITKGDLLDQESKIARSGLGELFDAVEIVSQKDAACYAKIYERHGVQPTEFLMVGNSIRSDVLPVIDSGGRAIHVPYAGTWAHENVPSEERVGYEFPVIEHLGQLISVLEGFTAADTPGENQ